MLVIRTTLLILRYLDPEDRGLLNRVISVISVVLSRTTLTISDSTGETVSMEYEIMRVDCPLHNGNIRDITIFREGIP